MYDLNKLTEAQVEQYKLYKVKPWLQHPLEEEKAYLFFQIYLDLHPENRTQQEAYDKMKVTPDFPAKPKGVQIGHLWRNFYNGKDSRGASIPGLLPFPERAKAYDKSQSGEETDIDVGEKRIEIALTEVMDGSTLLKEWRNLFDDFQKMLAEDREAARKNGKRFDASVAAKKLQEMTRLREQISVFLRRGVGMPERIFDDDTDSGKDVVVEWVEPKKPQQEMGKKALEQFEREILSNDEDFEEI